MCIVGNHLMKCDNVLHDIKGFDRVGLIRLDQVDPISTMSSEFLYLHLGPSS